MNYEILTMIVGFLGLLLMVWQLNYQTRSDITNLRSEVKADMSRLENRIEDDIKDLRADNKELRGLIIGLYSPRLLDKIDKKDVA